MDEGINAVYPGHGELILHEEMLDMGFPEYAKFLFDGDELKGMLFGCNDGSFDDENGGCCSSELVDLLSQFYLIYEVLRNLPSISKPSTSIRRETETSAKADSKSTL